MRRKIPSQWIEAVEIQRKAAELNIPDSVYQKTLERFRGGYYQDGESLNRMFYRKLLAAFDTYKRRSQSQRARHHKRPEHSIYESGPARARSSDEFARSQIEKLKQSLGAAL